MFTKSRSDKAKAQVQDAASVAGHQLREKVAPAVGAKARDAKEWATPRVERGLEAAAPKVEAAVDKISPAVDAAHDKIVDDLLPRLVEAVNAAAAAGGSASQATETARARGADAVAVLKGDAVAKPRHRKRKVLLVFTGIAAAVGAAVAVFKTQTPKDDPWAVPPGTYPATTTPTPPMTSPDPGLSVDSAAAADAIAESAGEDGTTTEAAGAETVDLSEAEAAGTQGPNRQSAKSASERKGKRADPLTDPLDEVDKT